MFGLGLGEILVILVVVLLVFGPDRLPEMTKQLASWLRDLRELVANARRDLRVSASDLGLDEEDIRTLRQLRNPKTFIRDRVLDGVDLENLDLERIAAEDDASPGRQNTNGQNGAGSRTQETDPQAASYDPDAT